MAVFRIQKTRDYTVMSNYHLKDRELSCKACGLLSKMLSLPDEWDFTARGLATLCRDGVDSIRSGLKELEERGYLIRRYLRDEKGRVVDMEYVIYETPQEKNASKAEPDTDDSVSEEPVSEEPKAVCPITENPVPAVPVTEKATQLNTKESSTNEESTKRLNTQRSALKVCPSVCQSVMDRKNAGDDGQTDGRKERERIRDQIDYPLLLGQYKRERVDELVELMLEVELTQSSAMIHFGRGKDYPAEYVRERFRQITAEHIGKVMDSLSENTTRVRNTKAYLLTTLFNAVSTLDNHYAMLVNHDLYGG